MFDRSLTITYFKHFSILTPNLQFLTLNLEPNRIHLRLIELDQATDPRDLPARLLSVDERARAERFVFDIHRQRYIVGRGWLRRLLAPFLDCDPADIVFSYNPYGKPLVTPRTSEAPEIQFSLAHSGPLAIYAFARCPVGIDIEKKEALTNLDGMARAGFSESEYAAWLSAPPEEKVTHFFRLWTLKEAYMKGKGLGFSNSPTTFDINFIENKPVLTADRLTPTEVGHWRLQEITVANPTYAAALAVRSLLPQINLE